MLNRVFTTDDNAVVYDVVIEFRVFDRRQTSTQTRRETKVSDARQGCRVQ